VPLLTTKQDIWDQLSSFYGIEGFPAEQLVFQKDTNRTILLLNKGLTTLMNYSRKNKLNVVNLGLKLFMKNKGGQNGEVDFRLLQEGVEVLLPFMKNSKRIIPGSVELFKGLTEANDNQINFEILSKVWNIN